MRKLNANAYQNACKSIIYGFKLLPQIKQII